ncbi:hypothetical protein BCR44DRAFT_1203148 [Catenaria anguillulae PL171]|uniref:Uncharacterized protein n=1 Tax=Catenaria anguillulae PL171 TaxID=765915 RepID=A0A1Y2HK24_9FUNG|nr:hypothetical protein BCR44DRAFT_1203148 [Catenaria anguillulae PL171]
MSTWLSKKCGRCFGLLKTSGQRIAKEREFPAMGIELSVDHIPQCFGQGKELRTACTNAKLHCILFLLLCPNRLATTQKAALAPLLFPLPPPAKIVRAQNGPCTMAHLEEEYADILPSLAAQGHTPSLKQPCAGVRAYLQFGRLGVPRVSMCKVEGKAGVTEWEATVTGTSCFNGCRGQGHSALAALDVLF